jgi:tRNA dimethylallyltransferase
MTVAIVAGATASGKTDLAIDLAQRFDAEIVGADSRQIYRGMEIGTAAPTGAQRAAVPHHLIGFLDPHERYSAARFARDATLAAMEIAARGRRAIVVGGTGFYLRALTGDVALAPEYDDGLRARLAAEARIHPPEVLHAWLRARDPVRAAALDPHDGYRIVRALEVALCSARNVRAEGLMNLRSARVPFIKVFLDVPLAENDARIAERTRRMLAGGFLDEAQRIGASAVAANAVGYPQALAYLRGWSTRCELEEVLSRATRRYARRQRAWFRNEPQTAWVEPSVVRKAAKGLFGWT